MHLADHQTKEADLLHDYAFADVRAHISDEVQGWLHQQMSWFGFGVGRGTKLYGISRIYLAGYRGKAADLLHDDAFTDVLDHLSDEWSSRPASSAALPVWPKVATRRESILQFQYIWPAIVGKRQTRCMMTRLLTFLITLAMNEVQPASSSALPV